MLDRQKCVQSSRLVPERSSSEIEIASENVKRYEPPGIDQIPSELIHTGVPHYLLRFTYFLILFGIRNKYYESGRNILLYLYIERMIKLTVVIIEECYRYQLHTKPLSTIPLSTLTPCVDEIIWNYQRGHIRLTTDHISRTKSASIVGLFISCL
jgi:hypothetical protein